MIIIITIIIMIIIIIIIITTIGSSYWFGSSCFWIGGSSFWFGGGCFWLDGSCNRCTITFSFSYFWIIKFDGILWLVVLSKMKKWELRINKNVVAVCPRRGPQPQTTEPRGHGCEQNCKLWCQPKSKKVSWSVKDVKLLSFCFKWSNFKWGWS